MFIYTYNIVNIDLLWQVKKLYQIYAESATGRINLYLKAIHTQDDQITMELIYQTKPFTDTGTKLLDTIKFLEVS